MVISILDRKLDVFSGVSKMKLHHLFFVLVLHILQGCCAQQMFREEPQYTEVNPGANAELRCVIENIGGECRWQKDGKPIGLYNGKYEWAARAGSGDCSLNLMAIDIKFDDGLWECQVTASSFESQDALASKPARLVVREPPKSFAIIQNNEAKESSTDITVVDGKLETIHCESRKSNPPPVLQWFLGDKQLRASVQKNVTEDDDTRRWKAYSVLEYVFSQDDFGKSLICRVVHPAYTNDHEETAVKLDLLYKPKVTVTRVADDVLEEGRSAVKMTCTSDANPPGRVFWRKYGASEERQFVETLEFNPVMRKDSGTYVCQAENAIGLSAEETVELDVLFPPKILRVTPGGGATIGVHNQSILTCSAEGNPLPKYVWLQKLPSNQVLKRGYEDKLIIDDTTYDHQGEYVCEAVNVIGDQKKIVQSEPVRMEVRGAPQVLRYSVAKEVEAVSGRDVRLEMEVCSDPIPSKTTWDWGSLRVEAGQDLHGRYLAEQMVQHPEREDCYIARLVVKKVSPTDSRRYFLRVENAHGEDRYAVELNVKEPVSMASVIGVVIGLLVLFVILVIVLLYAYKKQKLCFKGDPIPVGVLPKFPSNPRVRTLSGGDLNYESKLDKSIDGMNVSQGFDAEKAGHSNGLPSANGNGKNGGLNGNGNGIVGPLPPDGMYHVSDINGTGNTNIDMIHGSLTDKL